MRNSAENRARIRDARLANASKAREMESRPQPKLRHWIVLQGDVMELVDSEKQPDLTTKPGERRRVIVGAFADKDQASKTFEAIKNRARGIVGKGEAR